MKTFAVVGRKGAGRSESLLALVAELKKRGHRVGVVRHLQRDDLEIDQPGKDTYNYRMQGAEKVILSGRKRCAVFENRSEEYSAAELLEAFQGYDFIFFEEYYLADMPTIKIPHSMGKNPQALAGFVEQFPPSNSPRRARGEKNAAHSLFHRRVVEEEKKRKSILVSSPALFGGGSRRGK